MNSISEMEFVSHADLEIEWLHGNQKHPRIRTCVSVRQREGARLGQEFGEDP